MVNDHSGLYFFPLAQSPILMNLYNKRENKTFGWYGSQVKDCYKSTSINSVNWTYDEYRNKVGPKVLVKW